MGYYIDPKNMSKELFLIKHGTRITERAVKDFDFTSDSLPVVFVDNGTFTAAGIAYDASERDVFLKPDWREKIWFKVKLTDLEPYFHEEERMKRITKIIEILQPLTHAQQLATILIVKQTIETAYKSNQKTAG